ncbi:MAG: hypothetical protein Q9165_000326 [Trypethelium subeluteriae]
MHVFRSPTSFDKDTESILSHRLSTPISRPRRLSGMVNSSQICLINKLLFSLLLAILATCIVAYGIGTHACLASGGGASISSRSHLPSRVHSPMTALSCLWATQDPLPPEQQLEPELVPESELMEETEGWSEAGKKGSRKLRVGSTMRAKENEEDSEGEREGKTARGRGRWTDTVESGERGLETVRHLTVGKGVARPESSDNVRGNYQGTVAAETEDEWQRRAVGTDDGF